MKSKIYRLAAVVGASAIALAGFVPGASASVSVTAAPVALVTSPLVLPPSSVQTALFSFTLSANAGETLSNVEVQLNAANASTTVSGSHIASVSVYQDNGSNTFNPSVDVLVGSQSSVNLGSPTTITPSTTTPASGKFYVSLATAASWSATVPADSIIAVLPSNGINTSQNSPVIAQVSTAVISGQLMPSVTTAIHDSGENVISSANSGATVHDTIAVSGSGPVPTGSATFSFFDNNICSGSPAQTSGSFALSGGAFNATSFAQGPLGAGSYSFLANYSGDADYSASAGSCEPLTVTQSGVVSISTQLSAAAVMVNTPVTDSAVLNNTTATSTGTVTYNAYAGATCSGTPVFTDTETVSSNVVAMSKAYTPTAVGTYYWQAVYSGDANNAGATSSCGSEIMLVSQTQPTPPQTCTDGLINGRVYHLVGSSQFYIAANCVLQVSSNPNPTTPGPGGRTGGKGDNRRCRNIIGLSSLSGYNPGLHLGDGGGWFGNSTSTQNSGKVGKLGKIGKIYNYSSTNQSTFGNVQHQTIQTSPQTPGKNNSKSGKNNFFSSLINSFRRH